jgi:hypothetical protein
MTQCSKKIFGAQRHYFPAWESDIVLSVAQCIAARNG